MVREAVLEFVGPPRAQSDSRVEQLVVDHYGTPDDLTLLAGESDLNALVEGIAGGAAVLKISGDDAGGFAHFQTALIDKLAAFAPELPVPSIVPTRTGAKSVSLSDGFDQNVVARLTTRLPGRSLLEVTRDEALNREVGASIGRLDAVLASVELDIPSRPTYWNILRVAEVTAAVRQDTALMSEEGVSGLVNTLETFASDIVPLLSHLPGQLIHNDLNPSNLLVDGNTRTVSGVFDFGDVISAPPVIEAAGMGAYLVDDTSRSTLVNSLSELVSGYRTVVDLADEHVALIPRIMRTRFALALLMNKARAAATDDPAHAAYVLRNSGRSARRFSLLLPHELGRIGDDLVASTQHQ